MEVEDLRLCKFFGHDRRIHWRCVCSLFCKEFGLRQMLEFFVNRLQILSCFEIESFFASLWAHVMGAFGGISLSGLQRDWQAGKWQPLHTLAASGEFYLLGALLKHNADINFPDKDGLTALHKATLGKKQAIFNFLLRESANPFIRDKEGATLMHYAVQTASSQMIKILLLYNVDINLQDNYGWTPLHLAVQSRRTDIVRLLLIKGADKTLKNRDGLTPLDLCLYSGRDTRTYEQIKLIKMLPKHNSSV